jgi:hypothetical protein
MEAMQRRNRRAGVEDRWRRADGNPLRGPLRVAAGWPATSNDEGRENSRSFDRRLDGQAWLDEITAAQITGTYVAPRAGLVNVGELHAK